VPLASAISAGGRLLVVTPFAATVASSAAVVLELRFQLSKLGFLLSG
jgi:hypothetical protein